MLLQICLNINTLYASISIHLLQQTPHNMISQVLLCDNNLSTSSLIPQIETKSIWWHLNNETKNLVSLSKITY